MEQNIGASNTSTKPPQTAVAASCPSPAQIFSVAMAFSAFLAESLTRIELESLINLLNLITANLVAIAAQQEICDGLPVISGVNDLP